MNFFFDNKLDKLINEKCKLAKDGHYYFHYPHRVGDDNTSDINLIREWDLYEYGFKYILAYYYKKNNDKFEKYNNMIKEYYAKKKDTSSFGHYIYDHAILYVYDKFNEYELLCGTIINIFNDKKSYRGDTESIISKNIFLFTQKQCETLFNAIILNGDYNYFVHLTIFLELFRQMDDYEYYYKIYISYFSKNISIDDIIWICPYYRSNEYETIFRMNRVFFESIIHITEKMTHNKKTTELKKLFEIIKNTCWYMHNGSRSLSLYDDTIDYNNPLEDISSNDDGECNYVYDKWNKIFDNHIDDEFDKIYDNLSDYDDALDNKTIDQRNIEIQNINIINKHIYDKLCEFKNIYDMYINKISPLFF